jgi:SHS2 domain-containing protein
MKNKSNFGFTQIEHTADIGLQLKGETLEDLFRYSFYGLLSIVSEEKLTAKEEKKIEISAPDRESLLVDFLNELIFFINTKRWLPTEITNLFIEDHKLTASIAGANYETPDIITKEVKAATYHKLNIVENVDKWETVIYFDI